MSGPFDTTTAGTAGTFLVSFRWPDLDKWRIHDHALEVRTWRGRKELCWFLDEFSLHEDHRDYLAVLDDGELILLSGKGLERGLVADVTPWARALP